MTSRGTNTQKLLLLDHLGGGETSFARSKFEEVGKQVARYKWRGVTVRMGRVDRE
jgi:hypothetical protein